MYVMSNCETIPGSSVRSYHPVCIAFYGTAPSLSTSSRRPAITKHQLLIVSEVYCSKFAQYGSIARPERLAEAAVYLDGI